MKKKLGPRQRHAKIFATLREAAQASAKAEKKYFFAGEKIGARGEVQGGFD
ncbi:MAG: hypothetical protein JSV99_11650 [Planctomycetota bacterium]|nr:MAG: hypothetical protein JSV99_11650 [Planctomycetota bacterium]